MATAAQLARLQALPEPAYEVKATRTHGASALERARRGSFWVFDRWIALEAPVDWNPEGTHSFQARLQSWLFLDPLLQLARDGEEQPFRLAAALGLDWVRANGRDADGLNRYAWADKIAADRASYLGYLVRIGAARGWLAGEDAEALVDAVLDHGRWLYDDANYAANHNHGLHQDAGLATLARYAAPFADEAQAWGERALERFRASLSAVVDVEEGMYLEHSVAYQVNMVVLLRALLGRGVIDDPGVRAVLERMERAAGWLVAPDGAFSQIGDTNRDPAARYALPAPQDGLCALLGSGWAVVRDGGSYLITAATYFSGTHKHADELSFELSENGVRIVADAGKYAYAPQDPFRTHVRSAEAHSTLIVDGRGGTWFSGQEPYGSGLRSAAERDGWYAIRGVNPLVADRGVEHTRTFLYRPGEALIVVDVLRAGEEHAYTRLLQLDPAVEAAADGDGVRLAAGAFSGRVHDHRGGRIGLVRGREKPLLGWVAPRERERLPATALTVASRHAGGEEALVMALSPAAVALRALEAADGGLRAVVEIGGRVADLALDATGTFAGAGL